MSTGDNVAFAPMLYSVGWIIAIRFCWLFTKLKKSETGVKRSFTNHVLELVEIQQCQSCVLHREDEYDKFIKALERKSNCKWFKEASQTQAHRPALLHLQYSLYLANTFGLVFTCKIVSK